jgi:hypothetical protein
LGEEEFLGILGDFLGKTKNNDEHEEHLERN